MLMKTLRSCLWATLLAFGVSLAPGLLLAGEADAAAKPQTVEQIRSQWAAMKKTYLDSVAPLAGQPEHAALVQEYNVALDDTGKSLEAFIALKQANPPAAATQMTPAVDRLVKDLARMKALQGKAKGKLITIIGGALKQQQQITQNAIKNMR
jgi:hypothetical protein